ncbi:nucleolin [Orussus abietinus]|uniref:nucleolin n=1 Tax=Orussus abietinus TaxID=222816 RepID=UPI000625E5A2|nr:nucleolin [Orussus abietinus]
MKFRKENQLSKTQNVKSGNAQAKLSVKQQKRKNSDEHEKVNLLLKEREGLSPKKQKKDLKQENIKKKNINGQKSNELNEELVEIDGKQFRKIPVETLNQKIADIKSRDAITKTAKRKLAKLQAYLKYPAEGSDVLVPLIEKAKESIDGKKQAAIKQKGQKASGNKNKQNDGHGKKLVSANVSIGDEEEEDEDDEDEEDSGSEDADTSLDVTKPQKEKPNPFSIKLKQDNEAGDNSEDDEEDESDEDTEMQVDDGSDDEEVVDEEGSEDEGESEDDEEKEGEPKGNEVKKNEPKQQQKKVDGPKKKRFVLFVGNLPYEVKQEDLRKHFLTKVKEIVDIRIPIKPNTNLSRGIAYVELANNTDYEKGLSLHQTFFHGRRLNIQYTMGGSKTSFRSQAITAKNRKFDALRKAGILAGSERNSFKRNARRFRPQTTQ